VEARPHALLAPGDAPAGDRRGRAGGHPLRAPGRRPRDARPRDRYDGDRLALDEAPADLADDRSLGDAYWHASSTLALALAMEGKALVRSARHWEKCRHADGGPPEALAYKITLWEAFDRARGWRVEQPRIPGLAYPTWEEFEARWAAADAAFEAKLEASGGVIVADEGDDDAP
jgi:hypothetical protein